MKENNIAVFLKQLRKTSGYGAQLVTEMLGEYNLDISAKTLYGYESGVSMPNADAFVALCKIYRCDNPMEIFESASVSQDEQTLLNLYRKLNEEGKEKVLIYADDISNKYER